MLPGLRLRQIRERLGLTYRDVERISYELAARRGRSDFVLHISRLADIENHNTIPSLHKLYTLSVVYHLNPLELCGWYDVPLEQCFEDGVNFPSPHTHSMAAPSSLKVPCITSSALSRVFSYSSRQTSSAASKSGVKGVPRSGTFIEDP